ncbi:hypothetical protein KAR91_51475 [Candidatus Pacearchaeota archaeon]|nr:hypothetical protein [Candidatus Pacearchaeota archaeon]
MPWVKRGLIFSPENRLSWMVSHAQMPVADRIGEDIYRIYFASRDNQNRSHVGHIEINIYNPKDILYLTQKPVLKPGLMRYFDEHGVYPSSIVNYKDKKYLYYIGWNCNATPPLFYASIGLAISKNGGKTFNKISNAPILTKSEYDPWMVSGPHVMIEGKKWRMWYLSGIRWTVEKGVLKSYYHIKYAESKDGTNWKRNGIVCIDFKSKDESRIARIDVIKENGLYKGWYSFADKSSNYNYRIGYAESNNGINWERKDDEAGIDVSKNGFDNAMICYPFVIVHKGKKYMFYNGDNFGKNGIGLAVYE